MAEKDFIFKDFEEIIMSANSNCQKIKILYIFTSCKKTGPTQQLLNLISNLNRDVFNPYLITVYEEENESLIEQYRKVIPHECIKTSQKDMLLGRISRLKRIIKKINPDIIHTSGVLPDYMIARMGVNNHVLTSRNYVYEDYSAEFGRLKGTVLAKIHLYAIKHTPYAVCCSSSLHRIYMERENIDIPFIRNGVDLNKYSTNGKLKEVLRNDLGLPVDKKILVYGALFNDRKNQEFILKNFAGNDLFRDYFLLLLGDGPNFETLKKKYGHYSNIAMPGNTTNMPDYLRASDYYISSSKSEGLPNGVLEAMATGLPVFLSNIEQHLEVLEPDEKVGSTYSAENASDFVVQLVAFLEKDYEEMSKHALDSVYKHFSAQIMSENYQKLYLRIMK